MSEKSLAELYPHYHKNVAHLKSVDVYRVLDLFDVTDQKIGHAVKKLLCTGKRGGKDFRQDVTEARNTLNRLLQMLDEDEAANVLPTSS